MEISEWRKGKMTRIHQVIAELRKRGYLPRAIRLEHRFIIKASRTECNINAISDRAAARLEKRLERVR